MNSSKRPVSVLIVACLLIAVKTPYMRSEPRLVAHNRGWWSGVRCREELSGLRHTRARTAEIPTKELI